MQDKPKRKNDQSKSSDLEIIIIYTLIVVMIVTVLIYGFTTLFAIVEASILEKYQCPCLLMP